jgi:thiamine pyrophosphate-dependent acetolactate synthase large subunit-like protein
MTTPEAAGPGSNSEPQTIRGHGGEHAVAVARAYGVETLFTLSGAHVFPLYDAAVKSQPPMRLIDVRHESTAVFAAEATGKLTRTPGFAVLTAGPGVTNGVSAIAQAHFAGSPLVVLGGRAPSTRWGMGSLQELDHPPIVGSLTKLAETVERIEDVARSTAEAFAVAQTSHRGPAFLDVPMDQLFSETESVIPEVASSSVPEPDPDELAGIADLLSDSAQPVLVVGTDVWSDRAEAAALRLVESTRLPAITNGLGRGVIPAGHASLVSKARTTALGQADLVIVVGTPLDFRLRYGAFGGEGGTPPARVVHIADAAAQIGRHVDLAASASGDLRRCLDGVREGICDRTHQPDWSSWVQRLRATAREAEERDQELLSSAADPIHPARIYGELVPRLAADAVVIGDGGDFVSFAGKYVEPRQPGCWLDPGPYGCLGAGLGAAIAARIARPESQVVVLLGDGAAGMSLMDVDTLVRHELPVAMVVGNNSGWGLEKHPMRLFYGYDVAAELGHETAYDEVVRALGGAGESVSRPADIGPALDRAFSAGVPYLVNVITDPDVAYPRSTTGI